MRSFVRIVLFFMFFSNVLNASNLGCLEEEALFREKNNFFVSIQKDLCAEPDPVTLITQRIEQALDYSLSEMEEEYVKSKNLLLRLIPPEDLILSRYQNDILISSSLDVRYPAFVALNSLIEDLTNAPETLKEILSPFVTFYTSYRSGLLEAPAERRERFLEEKVVYVDEEGKVCRISQQTARTLLCKDDYGFPLKKVDKGHHVVSHIEGTYFKNFTPCDGLGVGKEAVAYWFAHVLFGRGVTPTGLVTLRNVAIKRPPDQSQASRQLSLALIAGKGYEQFFGENPKLQTDFKEEHGFTYPAQASKAVEDPSMEDYLDGKREISDLNLESYQEQVIFALLTITTDGTPANYRGSNTKITNIDADGILSPPIVLFKHAHFINLKNFLFCLSLMDRPFTETLKDRLVSKQKLSFFIQLLIALKIQENKYRSLAKKGWLPEKFLKDLGLPLRFIPGTFAHLVSRWDQMINFFNTCRDSLQESPTPNDLFRCMHPACYRYYQYFLRKEKDPLKAFMNLFPRAADQKSVEETAADNLEILETLRGETMSQGADDISNQTSTLADSLQEVLSLSKATLPHNLSEQVQRYFPYSISLSRELLIAENNKPLRRIAFSNKSLTDDHLEEMVPSLATVTTLTQLDFSSNLLTYKSLAALRKLTSLKSLNLRKNQITICDALRYVFNICRDPEMVCKDPFIPSLRLLDLRNNIPIKAEGSDQLKWILLKNGRQLGVKLDPVSVVYKSLTPYQLDCLIYKLVDDPSKFALIVHRLEIEELRDNNDNKILDFENLAQVLVFFEQQDMIQSVHIADPEQQWRIGLIYREKTWDEAYLTDYLSGLRNAVGRVYRPTFQFANNVRSFYWFNKSREHPNCPGAALRYLGIMYLYGWGTIADGETAKVIFKEAYAKGDQLALSSRITWRLPSEQQTCVLQ